MPDDAAEIADRFALGRAQHLTGPHANGFQAEVWRLQTDLGAWAVKRAFGSIAEADVAEGVAFQEAARAAGIATPAVCRSIEGAVLAQVHFGTVRVDEWVDLADADTALEPVDVGAMIADLHNVDRTPMHDIDGWYHHGVGSDAWADLIDRLVIAGAPFADALRPQVAELRVLDALVETSSSMQRCHRDLWADNVRRGGDGRVWVIDWQDCGAADPSFEIAALLFEYAYSGGARAEAMYSSYRRRGGPGSVGRPHDFSMAIAQLGHILQISCEGWLAARTPVEHRLNEGRVAEFIHKPLTRRVIERIVQAVGSTDG